MTNRARIFCNNCRNHTIHEIVYSHAPEQLEYLDLDSLETTARTAAKVWVCRGCENVTLQEINLNINNEEIDSEFYPNREKHHLIPKSYNDLDDKLSAIYKEIIISFNNEAQILCAAGLRALLEGICVDKNITGRNLYQKIDNLTEQLPENIVEGLHHFRQIGNKAVHDLSAPSLENLRQSIIVIEALLNYFYELNILVTGLNEEVGAVTVMDDQIKPELQTIKRIIERHPLIPRGQKELYRALYQAGNTGLKYEEIANAMGRTTQQIAGVLGALGRRINSTSGVEGKPGITYVFDFVKEYEDEPGAWGWRLKPEMRKVIKESSYTWAKEWK